MAPISSGVSTRVRLSGVAMKRAGMSSAGLSRGELPGNQELIEALDRVARVQRHLGRAAAFDLVAYRADVVFGDGFDRLAADGGEHVFFERPPRGALDTPSDLPAISVAR